MSTAVIAGPMVEPSPRLQARTAGAFWLLVFATGAFAMSVGGGLHCLLVGCLILRSSFLPRVLGALMVFAGLGWLTLSFANLLSPPLGRALSSYILIPGMLGEGALTLWLLAIGVNVERWKQQAGRRGSAAS